MLTVLYVAGTGHSGSTLLSFVLNAHPEILAIGEMHAPVFPRDEPNRRACSCGSPMVDCPFFRKLARRLPDGGRSFDPASWDLQYRLTDRPLATRLFFGSLRNSTLESLRDGFVGLLPVYRSRRARLDRETVAFVRAALEAGGKRVFLDATKDPIRIRFLAGLDGVRLKVIHLVRDPRSYAFSRMRDAGMTAAGAADAWLRTNGNVERHLAALPDTDHMLLRYESFCRETGDALERIAALAGVEPIPPPDDIRGSEHHIMGNKMRLPQFATREIRLDERWRGKLSGVDLDRIERVTGRMARRLGYAFE